MKSKIDQFTKDLHQSTGGHILYFIHDQERYIENTIAYIVSGAERGDRVFVIENERLSPVIVNKSKELLSKEQFAKVHFINNFDFYSLHGEFNSTKITAYFTSIINPYLQDNDPIRTWAHVEWGQVNDVIKTIGEYEMNANKTISELGILSVCAYDAERVPEGLQEPLMNNHDIFMTDDTILDLSNEEVK
ncbi:MEDS domain-containing protein [Metabacillus idriensis]|uniref:MEDS domain-containing protein n=1 Tax=Metabacillus idriensis TaxID=324768 RepID=UPI003D26862F